MFRLTPPSGEQIRRFISDQTDSPFSYPDVGATRSATPPGYHVDRNRIQLGKGERQWRNAVEAIRSWQMFKMPWVRLCWPSAPIQAGTVVAVLVRHFSFFSLNACRLVYVVDELQPIRRFGFAYGTLTEHAESGEERFMVEWNPTDDSVSYDILAFSRPNHALAKLAYPLSRSLQRRFAEHSKRSMFLAAAG